MSNIKINVYRRPDGRFGVRNHVAIISSADNSNFIARKVEKMVKGTVALCPCFGRGEIGDDMKLHINMMAGLGMNPNVYSVIIVSLEPVIAQKIADIIKTSGKRVEVFSMDEDGGSVGCTEKAIRAARTMVIEASTVCREEEDISCLLLGVECGGSDTTSGLVSNPVTGMVADEIIDQGGAAILSETTEWMGAEPFLLKRVASPEIGEKIVNAVKWYEDYIKSIGVDLNGFNPAPDNIKGGLSTIEEKAIGSAKKGGSRMINGLLSCGERPAGKGLYLMDAPTGGVENTTALCAAGCQVVIFSTGKGNPLGNPIVPTIKVTGNYRTMERCPENIDVDLSSYITEEKSYEEEKSILLDALIAHSNGKLTTSEVLGDLEIAITRIGYTV